MITVVNFGLQEQRYEFVCTFLITFSSNSSDRQRKRASEFTKKAGRLYLRVQK
ncbi:unnamed protein product [Hymenolepis diminuta]|uniref:Uncharacterized protein n=1 Tax=Hymenolepis diminuta TaxID=6216 RepID=A0A564ZAM7_HYMDI|nr:unnamed protein product [Hymenolepis diminuta]